MTQKALLIFLAAILLMLVTLSAGASEKSRLIVLTDIGGDPDDQMSMVRLMTYANHMDIEGLIATPAGGENKVSPEHIRRIVSAYGKVRDNLELHEPGYPTEEYLQQRISRGIQLDGMDGVGEGKDSPGSELLISVVEQDDPRPVWVAVWGGPNVLAQALWKVRTTRSPEELAEFVTKLRVYAISDQDNSGPWIRKEFPDLFYIVTPGVNAGGGFHHSTWIAIGGDKFHGRFGGADFSLVTNEWLDRNIRRKGPLGAVYPHWEFMMEGDTPSFFNLINNGLSDPEHPEWGGWGGRYELYTPRTEGWFLEPETRPIWTNVQDEVLGIDGNGIPPTTRPSGAGGPLTSMTSPHAWTGRSNPMTKRTIRRFLSSAILPGSPPGLVNVWISARWVRPIPMVMRFPTSGGVLGRQAHACFRTPVPG